MEEIKFRGYDVESKCWRYGYYMQKNDTILCVATPEQREANEHHLILYSGFCDWNMQLPYYQSEVDKKSLGQYIGLKDKTGKEIYKGDIVKTPYGIGSVKYGEYGYSACDEYCCERYGWYVDIQYSNYTTNTGYDLINHKGTEVIGNIYENPELLS